MMNKKNVWKIFVSRPLFLMWLAGVAFLIISTIIPQASLTDTNTYFGIDKIARGLLFLVLSFIPAIFFSSMKVGFCVATSMAPLGFILEMAQKFFPGRHFAPEDIIANNIGAVTGLLLALILRFLFKPAEEDWKRQDGRYQAVNEKKGGS